MDYKDKTKTELEYLIRKTEDRFREVKDTKGNLTKRVDMGKIAIILKDLIEVYEYYNNRFKPFNFKNKVILAGLKLEYKLIKKKEGG
jgi:hypothetical protein